MPIVQAEDLERAARDMLCAAGASEEAERLENEPSPEARRNQIPLLPNE